MAWLNLILEDILNESKRDNLLIPYWNLLREKGKEMSLGQFKEMMLKKLSTEGGMRQLSMQSNFYLAGAVRYYFNGDLTLNKNLSVFTNEEELDQWNREVCDRLDALIKYLRNFYIDNIGTKFEQPEDFGELPINKLLRKYGAKINKELVIVPEKKANNAEEDVPVDENVGMGYTFEIMLSAEDCRKYAGPTNPGHWCITSDAGAFRSYQRSSNGHFVIFRQNGWENVKREKTEGFPRDKYGSSLIAFVQSNDNCHAAQYRHGDFITSRWNHGHEPNTRGCEADHAFTEEQFKQITGVSDADLQKIYDTWVKGRKKKRGGSNEAAQRRKAANKEIIRNLKSIQILINGGENPRNLLRIGRPLYGDKEATNKSLVVCEYTQEFGDNESETVRFLMDKNRIIFDTIGSKEWEQSNYIYGFYSTMEENNIDRTGEYRNYNNNCVICRYKTYYMIYNIRLHSLLNIDGITKFKSIPYYGPWIPEGETSAVKYYVVRTAIENAALVNANTNMPVKLPNGQYWCKNISSPKERGNRNDEREVKTYFFGKSENVICFTTGDVHSPTFFLNAKTNRFINTPKYEGEPWRWAPYNNDLRGDMLKFEGFSNDELFSISFTNSIGHGETYTSLYDYNGNRVNIGNLKLFTDVRDVDTNIIEVSTKHKSFLYDLNKGFIGINGQPINVKLTAHYEGTKYILICGEYNWRSFHYYYIYDREKQAFVQNPYNFPSQYLFYVYESHIVAYFNGKRFNYGPVINRNRNDVGNTLANYTRSLGINIRHLTDDERLKWYKENKCVLSLMDNLQYIEPDYFPTIPKELLGDDNICAVDDYSNKEVQQMVTEALKRLLNHGN